MWKGTVDVATCTREDPCMGRRSTPSVSRLTVVHVVVAMRLQDAWSDRGMGIHIYRNWSHAGMF